MKMSERGRVKTLLAFSLTLSACNSFRPMFRFDRGRAMMATKRETHTSVLLQKVVRDAPLPLLVGYVRESFLIPDDLAIPYERVLVSGKDVEFRSDLARCWMTVEVLGIFVEEDEVVPSMAMIAVKRVGDREAGLVEASEKKIVKELERGLEDLVRRVGYKKVNSNQSPARAQKAEAELLEESNQSAELLEVPNQSAELLKESNQSAELLEESNQSAELLEESNQSAELLEVRNQSAELVEESNQSAELLEDNKEETKLVEKEVVIDVEANDEITGKTTNLEGGMAENGVDMTPEELLQDVLNFGEKEEDNFAAKAFETAKEILQTQKNTRVSEEDFSMQEELRQIFSAGQKLAEVKQANEGGELTNLSNADVLSMIEAENMVPKARQLEEDLAELEIRIARTPGEPEPSNVLDIFSPPEPMLEDDFVLDPNYPNTRSQQVLPPELEEALRNAKYASSILSKVEERTLNKVTTYFVDGKELTQKRYKAISKCVREAVSIGLIPDPLEQMEASSRFDILLNELQSQPDMFQQIVESYKDLLLGEHIIPLVRHRLSLLNDDDDRTRKILSQLVKYTMILIKQAQSIGAELEAMQLEVIRSICQVAMDPRHQTEQDAARALTDKVRDIKMLFDDTFVSYLKFAIAEEEGRLARRGLLDDPDHNSWLFVLKIVREGVYAELAKSINRHLEHIWYVLRMKTKAERRLLLGEIVDVMPSMDVRPFVSTVNNIVASLGTSVKGEFEGVQVLGAMTKELMQLKSDLDDLLPEDRINLISRDADEWAREKKEKMMQQRRELRGNLNDTNEDSMASSIAPSPADNPSFQ